jgi:hypothetical protein
MSDKIYAWLLRLYPSNFRERYGEEALQLFRDRLGHERGFWPRLRLWLDLVTDLTISLPRQYRYVQRALIASSTFRPRDGVPLFQVLESGSPRRGALLCGALLSSLTLGVLPLVISRAGDYPAPLGFFKARARPSQAVAALSSEINSRRAADAAGPEVIDRHQVIAKAVEYLNRYYVDPEVARQTGDALLAHEKRGDDDAVPDGAAFAELLTWQMKDVSHDEYLKMVYEPARTPDPSLQPSEEEIAQYRKEMKRQNCTFERVTVLPHNIGYIKLNSFPNPTVCRSKAKASMAFLNHADAIIFDLRDNRGGSSDMVALLATYLFDRPTHLNDFYDRGTNSTEQVWTLPPVPENKLAAKPVYVLISPATFSAGEGFSYDLKVLKRATLVGETTSGRGHMGKPHRIDDHFVIRIPGIRVTNPFSGTNWEGTGVQPDVRVKAADALETALKLAAGQPSKK